VHGAIVADGGLALATIRVVRKVLLLGYFGAGNFGDDALLCDWFARHGAFLREHDLRADVVAHGPRLLDGFTEHAACADLIDATLARQNALRAQPADYQALIIPGGSLLQDVTSLRSLLYYLLLIRRFTSAGVPAYLLHQGFGPFQSWLARVLTPRLLRRCRFIACRDEASLAWTRAPGRLARHPELHASADPILAGRLALDPAAAAAWNLPPAYILALPRPTGDLPSPGDATTEHAALAQLLTVAAQASGLPVLLLPLQRAQDEAFARAVASAVPDACRVLPPLPEDTRTGTAALTALAQAQLVISHRLHGIIAAAAHGVPALGVAYDPKVESCCEELGLPYCFPATVHEDTARTDIERLWRGRAEAVEVLHERRAGMLVKLITAEERYIELWRQDCG
jgi:polysaccharide pyruvyl transferase CsaB